MWRGTRGPKRCGFRLRIRRARWKCRWSTMVLVSIPGPLPPRVRIIWDCKVFGSGARCSAEPLRLRRGEEGPRFSCIFRSVIGNSRPSRAVRRCDVPAAAPKIRVLIADDHAVLRAGLKLLVNSQPDMEVVGEAVNGRQAIERVRAAKPDVALLDLTMPGSGGMEALETLAEETAKVRIVILTMHDDPAYLRSVFAAGASGYVLKRSVDAELLSAIRAVGRGGTFIDPSLAGFLVRDAVGGAKAGAGRKRPAKLLSDRETQVLILVARGYSSQEIADQIFVSVKTVETYRARLAGKLGLRSRSDVVRYALQMGLLTPEAVQREQKHSA